MTIHEWDTSTDPAALLAVLLSISDFKDDHIRTNIFVGGMFRIPILSSELRMMEPHTCCPEERARIEYYNEILRRYWFEGLSDRRNWKGDVLEAFAELFRHHGPTAKVACDYIRQQGGFLLVSPDFVVEG